MQVSAGASSRRPGEDLAHEFDRVADRYDLMTRLNPGYLKHLRWSARRLGLGPRARILDLCCGTGLSTEALCEVYPDAEITGLDASAGMLARARRKPFAARVSFVAGDAARLGDLDLGGPYDGVLMAYGLRNLPDPDATLAAVRALLVPGGALCVHEYSVADSWRSRMVWNAVTRGVVIPLGRLTSPGSAIYRYLRQSVLDFDGVRALEARLERAGFASVHTLPMDGWQRGIVHSFLGRRPA